MDSTSNRTKIDLTNHGPEITFEGWELLESVVYDLWLSPCKTYLVQHYKPRVNEDMRVMRAGYMRDFDIQEDYLRNLNRMGQLIGYKNFEFMLIHEFTGCHWYGNEDFPKDFPELLADLRRVEVTWPNIRPGNLYRNPEGELRCIGPYLAFNYRAQPVNLTMWTMLLTPEEFDEIKSIPKDGPYMDMRLWEERRLGPL